MWCKKAVREIGETYTEKLAMLREMHTKRWEEFLQIDSQRRQQQQAPPRHQIPGPGYAAYKQPGFSNYDGSAANPNPNPSFGGPNMGMDSMNRYPNPIESNNYPSRPHENFGEFQHQRREDYGKAYNRY